MSSQTETRKFPIIDYRDNPEEETRIEDVPPLSKEFGRNLDTIEKARQWLTNPHNWHTSKLFILKWDGLLCTVMDEHGRRLIENPEDNGLPWCVVYGQAKRRARPEAPEEAEETESQEDL